MNAANEYFLFRQFAEFVPYIVTDADVNMPVCPCCDRIDNTTRMRRINTAYHNDNDNLLVSCAACYQETIDYYAELVAEYWDGVL